MNLNQIAFSLCESTTLWNLSSFNNFLPTIDINFNRAQIKYCRCRNYSKKIEITSENLFGVSYIYSHCIEKESKVLIQGFANNLNKRKELYISTFLKQKNEDSFNFSFKETDSTAKTKSNIDFQEESMFNKSSGLDNSDKFSMQMEISYEGAKKIEITLQNFDFLLNLNLFFRIIGFFNFDNFVSVVTPNG